MHIQGNSEHVDRDLVGDVDGGYDCLEFFHEIAQGLSARVNELP